MNNILKGSAWLAILIGCFLLILGCKKSTDTTTIGLGNPNNDDPDAGKRRSYGA